MRWRSLQRALHSIAPGRRALVWSGLAATGLFVAVRVVNGYGDPFLWTTQESGALTLASFLNTRKYRPSLDFLLMTLGPSLIALALLERARGRLAEWVSVYGRVPLFYYVVHIAVAHAVGLVIAFAQGGGLRRLPIVSDPSSIPDWYGVSLPGVYVAWAVVVLAVYPVCRWFARLKAERRDWWLSYL